jgi:hypothetical protein
MPLRTRSKTRSPASSSSGSSSNRDVRRELPGRAAKKQVQQVDKENVKNAIAFQPPSPLTSRRKSAQKGGSTSAKKVLSPNRNSQWNRESGRQLRSSPIHHAGYQVRVFHLMRASFKVSFMARLCFASEGVWSIITRIHTYCDIYLRKIILIRLTLLCLEYKEHSFMITSENEDSRGCTCDDAEVLVVLVVFAVERIHDSPYR